ncbi:hypothetical protein I8748_28545 [Nostoc sp. CENA67]|uniref:Uncharacterized protein n=1 Tax=Amazonocrinis nigriterrae CENA67 TaxID=2794033 RepID=A0A8J7LBS6_9NOST|nr:hypothetical protein [Amazonocrinis nigriterrae]MBH8566065.1 hypothetical protein [Amazonocrinis nigriterrae CENA67]
MAINFTKRLSVLAVTIFTLFILMPVSALATPVQFHATSSVIFAQTTKVASESTPFSEINLTPQQLQQLQAVRQRRNKEIKAVLNSSQLAKLAHNLHSGQDINQALKTLNLQPEQQELVEAILKFANLKMKAIISRNSLTVGQK